MSTKIALGTAQFGLTYGVANTTGQPRSADVERILRCASLAAMDTLDTAIAYGTSEACLGDIGVNGWKVVTKLSALPSNVTDVESWVRQQVDASLARLGIPQLDGLLLHRPQDLIGPCGKNYCRALKTIKDSGKAKSIGVSIYAPTELNILWPVFVPDLVQAPLNILDQRLIQSGWLTKLRACGVRVHTRSTFLQGLLLMDQVNRPSYFHPWQQILDEWAEWCATNQCSTLEAALGFALSQNGVEKVIIGVDTVNQLESILQASATNLRNPVPCFSSHDVDLIEPSRWKLQ